MARRYRYSGSDPYAGAVFGANAAVPEREPLPEEPQREHEPLSPKKKRELRRRRRYLTPRKDPAVSEAPAISFFGFIFLTLVSMMLVYSCVTFLHVKYEYSYAEKNLAKSEKELAVLQTENDNQEKIIYSNIDLEEIRKTAIEKFGMVYPDSSQIIKYDKTEAGYVRQYAEVSNTGDDDFVTALMRGIAAK